MARRPAVVLALLLAGLAAPAAAGAATLSADRSCYGPGERIQLTGTGFTPGSPITVSRDGRLLPFQGPQPTVNSVGVAGVFAPAPDIGSGQRRAFYAMADATGRTASTSPLLTALDVSVRPRNGRPGSRLRIRARGFTRSRTLYAHVRRGRFRRDIRIGRLRGVCKTISARARIFRSGTRSGTYRVTFDGSRRFSKNTAPSVSFQVRIFRVLTRRSSISRVD